MKYRSSAISVAAYGKGDPGDRVGDVSGFFLHGLIFVKRVVT